MQESEELYTTQDECVNEIRVNQEEQTQTDSSGKSLSVFDFSVLTEKEFPRGKWTINQMFEKFGAPDSVKCYTRTNYNLVFIDIDFADISVYFFPIQADKFSFNNTSPKEQEYNLSGDDKELELSIMAILIKDNSIALPYGFKIGQSKKEQIIAAYNEGPASIILDSTYLKIDIQYERYGIENIEGGILIYQYGFPNEKGQLPDNADIDGPNQEMGSINYYLDNSQVLKLMEIRWPWSFDI